MIVDIVSTEEKISSTDIPTHKITLSKLLQNLYFRHFSDKLKNLSDVIWNF